MEIRWFALFSLLFLTVAAGCNERDYSEYGNGQYLATFRSELTTLLSSIKKQDSQKGTGLIERLSKQVTHVYILLGKLHEGRGTIERLREAVQDLLATIEKIKAMFFQPPPGNLVVGNYNAVLGDCNFVNGHMNCVAGDVNNIVGSKNQLSGDSSTLVSSNSRVSGRDSFVVGTNTVVNGNSNIAFANG